MAVMIVIESLKLAQRLLQSAKKTYMKFMSHHFDIVLYSCSKLLHPCPKLLHPYPKLLYSSLILLDLCTKLLHPWPNCCILANTITFWLKETRPNFDLRATPFLKAILNGRYLYSWTLDQTLNHQKRILSSFSKLHHLFVCLL